MASDDLDKFWAHYYREQFRGEVNNAIIEALMSKGMSWADLAAKLCIPPGQVRRWLSSPSALSLDEVADIAFVIGLLPSIQFQPISPEVGLT